MRATEHEARRGPIGRLTRSARRGLLDRRGTTAIEFAIVGAPFVLLIFSIIELALYFMVQVTLDNATALAARQLRTGQIVADGGSDAAGEKSFLQAICSNMSWLQSQCTSGTAGGGVTPYLVIDVRPLSSYSAGSGVPPAILNGQMNSANFCYYSGSAGNAVEMRAFYRWQLFTPFQPGLQTFANGIAELQSTEVFQVEPNGQTNPSATQC